VTSAALEDDEKVAGRIGEGAARFPSQGEVDVVNTAYSEGNALLSTYSPVAPMSRTTQQIEPAPRLQHLFARGVAWKLSSQVLLQAIRFATVVALAHVILPSQFGLAAMALVLSAFVIAFTDVGLGAALVQRATLTEADTSTCFWVSLGAGAAFSLVTAAAAGPIASFYGHPQVKPLVQVLSITFFINALGATHRSLLARKLDFRSLELRTLAGTFVGGGVAVVIAINGGGAWSLIAQDLAAGVVSTAGLWILSSWRPRFTFSGASTRTLAKFGGNTVGARVLNDITATFDNVLVGRFLGATPLGLYAITYKTILIPLGRIALPIQEVLFPAMARMQDEAERLRHAWLRASVVTAAIAAPMLAGLVIVAPDFTRVVLGSRWLSATPLIQIMSIVGLAQVLQATGWSAFAARNKAFRQLRYSIVATTINVGGFALGLHWGLKGIAICYATTSTVLFIAYTSMTLALIGSSWIEYLRAMRGIAVATAVMAATALGVRSMLLTGHVAAPVRLVVCIVAASIVYVSVVLLVDRRLVRAACNAARLARRAAPATGTLPVLAEGVGGEL
jgi:O-antigen/teichoic acid export membrane protein